MSGILEDISEDESSSSAIGAFGVAAADAVDAAMRLFIRRSNRAQSLGVLGFSQNGLGPEWKMLGT